MACNRCGACCIEISISSLNKPAGVPCEHLVGNLCGLFGKPERPAVCSSFQAEPSICGTNKEEATFLIRWYEQKTSPQ